MYRVLEYELLFWNTIVVFIYLVLVYWVCVGILFVGIYVSCVDI